MPTPPQKDRLQKMLQAAAAGDESAWRFIVETYAPRVYGLIRAQCGDANLAEEISQSTFATVVAKIDRYSEVGRFEAWLFRIAMNKLRDEKRRQRRQARPVEDEALQGMAGAAAGPSPADAGDIGADLQKLRGALEQLSDADRRVIHLRHNAELSFKEIGEVLGQPLGTVLARHHRAMNKLRGLMGGER